MDAGIGAEWELSWQMKYNSSLYLFVSQTHKAFDEYYFWQHFVIYKPTCCNMKDITCNRLVMMLWAITDNVYHFPPSNPPTFIGGLSFKDLKTFGYQNAHRSHLPPVDGV